MTRAIKPVESRVSATRVGSLFYEKAAGMLMAVGAVASTSDAAIIHWEGSVTDTGNLAPSGETVGLQIGTYFGSTAYGFVKGIGALSLPADSLSGFFRETDAKTIGAGNTFGAPGGQIKFAFAFGSDAPLPVNNSEFSSDNLFAFSFTSAAVNGGAPVYGWARLTIPSTLPITGARITEWAYDDTGHSIGLGTTAIPEPSSLALLAAGAVGGVAAFHRHRNRRKAVAAA